MRADKPAETGPQLQIVLSDLERVFRSIDDPQLTAPTPCPDFTVADLRNHILGWATFFAAAANDPDGETSRPDPKSLIAPESAAEAAGALHTVAADFQRAIAGGVADGDIALTQGPMPGAAALQLILWEYVVHGWDLATATGQQWQPPEPAVAESLTFATGMLTPEWRGKDFGEPVEVPDDAPPLTKLLGFTGRDPGWVAG